MKALGLLFALNLFATNGLLCAQQTTLSQLPDAPWRSIETLAPGTGVHLAGSFGRRACRFQTATADELTCRGSTSLVLGRADIITVKGEHRGRSTVVMAALGAGVGVLVVAVTGSALGFHGIKGSVAAGGAGLGAAIFAPIGYFTDPTASTLYRKH